MECIELRFQITTPTDIKICRGIFVFCVAFIPLRTVEDACPYKENLNFLMSSPL